MENGRNSQNRLFQMETGIIIIYSRHYVVVLKMAIVVSAAPSGVVSLNPIKSSFFFPSLIRYHRPFLSMLCSTQVYHFSVYKLHEIHKNFIEKWKKIFKKAHDSEIANFRNGK